MKKGEVSGRVQEALHADRSTVDRGQPSSWISASVCQGLKLCECVDHPWVQTFESLSPTQSFVWV